MLLLLLLLLLLLMFLMLNCCSGTFVGTFAGTFAIDIYIYIGTSIFICTDTIITMSTLSNTSTST